MRYPLLLFAAAVAALLVWAFVDDSDRSDAGARPAPSSAADETGRDAPVPPPLDAPAEREGRVSSEAVGASGDGATSPPAAEVASPIAGVVLWEDDRTPLASFSFALRFASSDEVVRLETDALGRFVLANGAPDGLAYPLHRPSAPDGPFPDRLLFVARSVAVSGERTARLELLVRRPEARLVVRVVLRDGAPEPGALVEVVRREEPRPDEERFVGDGRSTDEHGTASFALYDLASLRSVELVARQSPERGDGAPLVSAPQLLELPLTAALLATPVTLVLDDAATLVVRVLTPAGSPIPDKRVVVTRPDRDLGVDARELPVTDAEGSVRVEGLAPGAVAVWLVETPVVDAERITLAPGETRELRVELNEFAARLAVAGRVLDESGAPLAGASLSLSFGERIGAGVTTAVISSRADGTFSFEAEPCEQVTVRADASLSGDAFDPPSTVVRFGARDVVFRRTERYPVEVAAFDIVDATTKEPCRGAFVLTFRAPNREVYSFHVAEDGSAAPRISSHPDTTLVVTAPGYRRRELPRAEVFTGAEPRVELDPGVHRVLLIRGEDAAGESIPLVGARVYEGDDLVAEMTSSDGVLVDLFAPLTRDLRIEAAGFVPATWNPADDLGELGPAWIWMDRIH